MTPRSLAANSALALAADVASKAGVLAVITVSARLLSVGEFSALVTALAGAGLLTSAVDLGGSTLLTRDGAGSAEARGTLLRALVVARLPLVALTLVGVAIASVVSSHPLVPPATAALALAGAASLLLSALFRAAQNLAPEATQRLAAALLSVAAAVVCGLTIPRADVLVAALAAATILPLGLLALRVPQVVSAGATERGRTVFRRALPLGLLALATIAYYRSGTLVLAALGDARATSIFGVAATVAFGLLAVPNAITTALLPRLAALRGGGDVTRTTRAALAATLAIAVPLAAAAAAAGPWLLPLVFGRTYGAAAVPFGLLCAGLPVIAASGVIGTALVAIGRLRALAWQVGLSLAVNLAGLALLAPTLGASGAALATLACEASGLVLLVLAARRVLPGLTALRRAPVKARPELAEAA